MKRRTFLAGVAGALLMPLAAGRPGTAMAQAAPARTAERRLALVIGNGDYRFSPLKNPVNDARAMAEALRGVGFTVEYQENAGKRAMIEAIRSFVLKSSSFDVRLFYYAGHGVQMNGRNYLIPVDADIQAEDEIAAKGADVGEMLERLGRIKTGMNLVILDACRNNPFADGATAIVDGRRLRFRGTTPAGLAPLEAPTGSLIAFSTAPGAVAIDGIKATHSLYTKHLLQHISTPRLPVEQVFKRVRIAVTQESQRQQVPWESSSLMGDFCFRTLAGAACP